VSNILAFDTSGERMHIGLSIGARTWLHESAGGANASSNLLPTILELLRRADVKLADLDAFGFGRGPGAFTGLRTACSVAQGLALGAGKPVLPIDTLMAVAEDARRGAQKLQVWVTTDARMQQIYAAHFQFEHGSWSALDEPALTNVQALNATWRVSAPQHVAGNALVAFAGQLECTAAQCHLEAAPRAAALLALAQELWRQGCVLDASAALPRYVRDRVAQTVAERAAGRHMGDAAQGPPA
jgi:tRNA threonylcarbamoyladenosine biosynthesis protein TsaB